MQQVIPDRETLSIAVGADTVSGALEAAPRLPALSRVLKEQKPDA
jgi:hypothetical protein